MRTDSLAGAVSSAARIVGIITVVGLVYAPSARSIAVDAVSAAAAQAVETVVDQQGPDDEPGQKDLNFLTVDNDPVGHVRAVENDPDTLTAITWGWDDTAWSGANTGDACALFDTDDDTYANYSLCITVTVQGDFQSIRLYVCESR
jgi:hypothetical protein